MKNSEGRKHINHRICKTCGHESEDSKTIVLYGYEYELETHDKNKILSDIQIPKGWELWDIDDFKKFTLKDFDTLKLWDEWFFIKQPIKAMQEKGYVAGFVAYSGGAVLDCDWDPAVRSDGLGVRFKRKVKK